MRWSEFAAFARQLLSSSMWHRKSNCRPGPMHSCCFLNLTLKHGPYVNYLRISVVYFCHVRSSHVSLPPALRVTCLTAGAADPAKAPEAALNHGGSYRLVCRCYHGCSQQQKLGNLCSSPPNGLLSSDSGGHCWRVTLRGKPSFRILPQLVCSCRSSPPSVFSCRFRRIPGE